MLRITRVTGEGSKEVLRVEGKLRGPWVDELAAICSGPVVALRLDLSAVTFVDDAGERLLRRLIEAGAILTASSGYVAALLQRGDPAGRP